MSDTLFDTPEAAPKTKRVPPKNEIIGHKRADAWDLKLEQIAGQAEGTSQTVEALAAAVNSIKNYIFAMTAVVVAAVILVNVLVK